MELKFNKLRENHVYVVTREDGVPVGVTASHQKVQSIILDQFEENGRVSFEQQVYDPQETNYHITIFVFYDENDEEGMEYLFKVTVTPFSHPLYILKRQFFMKEGNEEMLG